MTVYPERDNFTILTYATDPEFDPLFVSRINGDPALIGAPLPLSIGGTMTITADGTSTFDDTGFTWPLSGQSKADGVIAEISDGTNYVSVAVSFRINRPS